MTYLFSNASNATIINEVEIKNNVGNAIPVTATLYNGVSPVTLANPLPVSIGSSNIQIFGNTNIIDTVTVTSTPQNPVHVHLTEIGTGNVLLTDYVPIQGNVITKYDTNSNNLQLDKVGRLRVASQTQMWWYAPTVDKDGDLRYIEQFTGAGAQSDYIQNLSSISISSGTDSNGSAIRISRRRHKMRPGVSIMALFSINWNGYDSGIVTKRAGLFTAFNGIFYEVGTDLNVVIRRRLIDGTLVEKRVARSDFNIDKLDGTGSVGLDLRPVVLNQANITAYVSTTTVPVGNSNVYNVVYTVNNRSQFEPGRKFAVTGVSPATFNGTAMVSSVSGTTGSGNVTVTYITNPGSFSSLSNAVMKHTALHNQYVFGFDFAGSRSTNVRFFVESAQGRIAIHNEDFSGELSTPFANAPAMSTRYEVINSGLPAFRPSFVVSSEVVNVEAELELSPGFGAATNNTGVIFQNNLTEEYAILGIGLRAGEPYQRGDLQIQDFKIVDIGNLNKTNAAVFYWRLLLNPTISGTIPTPVDIGKATRQWSYTTNNTVSGGTTLLAGYSQSLDVTNLGTALNFINIGSNIDYTDADKIVLIVKQVMHGTSDAIVLATMNFIEAL
jgi:hypothetical protein